MYGHVASLHVHMQVAEVLRAADYMPVTDVEIDVLLWFFAMAISTDPDITENRLCFECILPASENYRQSQFHGPGACHNTRLENLHGSVGDPGSAWFVGLSCTRLPA